MSADPSLGPRAEDERLVAFVTARTGEDEAAAEAATAAAWTNSEPGPFVGADGHGIIVQARHGEDAAHIARHDPARVLREVAAKRRRLEDYQQAARACRTARPGQSPPLLAYRDACYQAVLTDAAVWADHPDFEHRWKLG